LELHPFPTTPQAALARISRLAPATALGFHPSAMGSPPYPKNMETPPAPALRSRLTSIQDAALPPTQRLTQRVPGILCPIDSTPRQRNCHVLRLSPTTEYPASRSRPSRSQPTGRDAGYPLNVRRFYPSRVKEREFPFVPKSTKGLRLGDFWAISLDDGQFACGRVLAFDHRKGKQDLRGFLAGLLHWVSDSPPTFDSIAGAQTVIQGVAHLRTILATGGTILGKPTIGVGRHLACVGALQRRRRALPRHAWLRGCQARNKTRH